LSQMTRSQLCRRSLSKHFVEVPLKMACFDKVSDKVFDKVSKTRGPGTSSI
jgi:hypothetical protein